ncbi:GIP, partial [Symbiodinium sp. CCMP2456]
MELPLGDLVLPLASPEDFAAGPPRLDNQNCFAKNDNAKAIPSEPVVDPLDPEGIFDSGIDLYEELAKMKASASEPIPIEDDDKSSGAKGSGLEEVAKSASPAKAEPVASSHDPTMMPDGTPVPPGYNFDGIRLVRNKRGSQRPPDTSSEDWHMVSVAQREADKERYQAKLRREAAAREAEARDAARAMPVIENPQPESHRLKGVLVGISWGLTADQFALVARVVNQAEIDRTPEAKAAMDKEWQKLVDK